MLKTGVLDVDPRPTFSAVTREAPSRSAAYAGQRTVPGLRDRASKVCCDQSQLYLDTHSHTLNLMKISRWN